MIPKRLSTRYKLVSHYDPALTVEFDIEKRSKYTETLDIKELGDLNNIPVNRRPTIFVCEPLKAKYEYLAYTNDVPDYWAIFATHVVEIQDLDLQVERDANGFMADSVRDQLPPEVYHDIGNKILLMSNRGNAELFFSPPVGSSAYARAALAKHQAKQAVDMVDAKDNTLK
jgi:hypothetical protein